MNMKNLMVYLQEGRTDYIETAKEVTDKLKDMKCPKGGEKIFIDLSDDRKICIYNDDKSVYQSIRAHLEKNGEVVDRTQEGCWYGKEHLSGNNVTAEEAFNRLKQRLSKNNIEMYNK